MRAGKKKKNNLRNHTLRNKLVSESKGNEDEITAHGMTLKLAEILKRTCNLSVVCPNLLMLNFHVIWL